MSAWLLVAEDKAEDKVAAGTRAVDRPAGRALAKAVVANRAVDRAAAGRALAKAAVVNRVADKAVVVRVEHQAPDQAKGRPAAQMDR
jgi:hypothetical protein